MIDGTLQKESMVKFSNIFTLQEDTAIKRIGQLNLKKMDIVINSIMTDFIESDSHDFIFTHQNTINQN